MESEEETLNGKKISPSDPPNHAECVDESSGSKTDCEDLGDRPNDHIGQHESTFNEKEEANDSVKQHEENLDKEEENVYGNEGISIPGAGNQKSSADCIVVQDPSESDNLEHQVAGDGEEGYELFVKNILSNLSEPGNAQDDNPNIRELGQPGGLSSDCKEDGPESNVPISNISLTCTGFPVGLNIPRVDDVGHDIMKDGTSNGLEDSVKETCLRQEAALISPSSDDTWAGVAQRRPPIDDEDDTNTRNGESPGLNDLDQSDTTLDSDDDVTPSEDGPSRTASHHSTGPANKAHQKHRSDCNGTSRRDVKPNHPSFSPLSAEEKRSNAANTDEQKSASDKKYGHFPHDHNCLDSSVNVNTAYEPAKWAVVPYFGLNGNETMKHFEIESSIELPVPRNLRGYRWLAESAQRFKLGASGYSYEGGVSNGNMHGLGRLIIGDQGQFLEGYWWMNHLADLRFCQFTLPGSDKTIFIVKRLEDYLLSIRETRYVASATVNSLEDLDLRASIESLKKTFLTKITILKILEDELNDKREASLNKFKSVLQRLVGEDANPIIRATVWILLGKSLRFSNFNLSDLLDRNTPNELQDAVNSLHTSERRYMNTTSILFNTSQSSPLPLREIVSKMFSDSITKHKEALISKCPTALPRLASEIQKLDHDKIVYIVQGDVAVFEHIVSQPCFERYKGFFENLVERFCLTIQTLGSHTCPYDVIPLMPSVYGFLVKSFWEMITEIVEVVDDYKPEDMLKYESGNWHIEDDIKLPENESGEPGRRGVFKFFKASERKSSLHLRSLVIQYKTLFQIMKRFSPGNHINGRKCDFKFSVLEQELSVWQRGMKMVGQSVGLARRLENLSPERVAWLYLLDYTIHNALKDEPNYKILLKSYNSLLSGHISFIEKSATESHEKFRVMTHNTVKFIISTVPYFSDSQGKPGIDVNILVQQIRTLSNASRDIEHDQLAFSNSRDLFAEYNRYLNLRLCIDIEAAPGYFSSQITGMMQTFMRIVADSLKKSVPTAVLVTYLRSLNDFLDDFKNIDFLGLWYVKSRFYDQEVMEKIDNKLAEMVKCSYRVTDIQNYVNGFQLFGHQPPEHYILHIVTKLLKCVETCLGKQWASDQLQVAQLESTSVLLDTVRQSFMYLKEQPDYLEFETFKKESVDPFVRLVSECSDTETLKKRANTVKESFWYIRKMDEISIDQAVAMFNKANTCPDSDKILSCYESYIKHYEEYVAEYSCSIASGKTHSEGLDAVRQKLDLPAEPLHYSEWTEEFKTNQIPTILAGLSAVWSILVSEDVSSTGKFLKPHCIQILCVMRLLGIDSPEVANHIAQVLTGQGKSVILALLSSTLALTGHEVRVLCYSSYLSSRDLNDFEYLFQKFQIVEKIHYSTFKHMANSLLNPTLNGIETSLRDLVKEKVLNHTDWLTLGSVSTESKKMVLLIDEVDVFFTKDFYGNSYCPVTTIGFRGLERVQEHIWTLALSNNYTVQQIVQHSEKFIADEVAVGNTSMIEFKSFLNKPGTFSLLVDEGEKVVARQYSNRSMFSEHLLRMIEHALHVRNGNTDREYRLNTAGVICVRGPDNIYSPDRFVGYHNTFNYFRLKGSDYDSKNSRNYGYLILGTGSISYARLPSQFSLILGVSGTVSNLGKYERNGLESYRIDKLSILPTFFGDSNLKFNQEKDFHYFNSAQDWLKKIYSRADQMVMLRRAVLIFFESDVKMKEFSKEYKIKFDRLNEITANTEARVRDVYIEEAGLPCAVTLATREMGRGVDYKSSLSVEKNGGVHVIQTFLSTDVKEEVQIKGRTARKDNRGSYEMVICREHLVRNGVIPSYDAQNHSYASLDEIRQQLSDEEGQTVAEKIQKCERNHIATMKFFGLM